MVISMNNEYVKRALENTNKSIQSIYSTKSFRNFRVSSILTQPKIHMKWVVMQVYNILFWQILDSIPTFLDHIFKWFYYGQFIHFD